MEYTTDLNKKDGLRKYWRRKMMIMTSNDLRYFLRMSDSTLRTWRLLGMPHIVLKKGYLYDSEKVREWLYSKSIREVKYAKYLRRMDMAISEHTN